ncbi:MAG TPA: nucleoside triphosphate pyrophosphohydrolase [Bacteroidetes bacterium]|nr:nucleoside triphosphate pyrophosphohydrolase/pyrophosphatase MazG [bacterium BMS3Bbin03]HDK35313.1 nucleoside triphosphate pyrophosphohydrolase [Bacteroidota bacterium]
MAGKAFDRLVSIMNRLRQPDGCPWDQEQTHRSLRRYLLEETYEVLETLDNEDFSELKEELGDLLLQVVFHAQLAKEEGVFTIEDVIEGINAKLIRRHPNVFGDAVIDTAEEQTRNWELLKKEEGRSSAIQGVPKELPALLRAWRIQQKAAQVGFDWDDIADVWAKVEEELNELKEASQSGNPDEIEAEFGDVLFALVNLSRFLKLNPEDALRRTIRKFRTRFQKVEQELKSRGKSPEDSNLKEMDEIWNLIKKNE